MCSSCFCVPNTLALPAENEHSSHCIFSFFEDTPVHTRLSSGNSPILNMKIGILFSLVCAVWLTVLVVGAKTGRNKYEAAARCIALNSKCKKSLADRSIYCKPFTYVKKQNKKCLKNACSFCSPDKKPKRRSGCNSWAIRHWCFGRKKRNGDLLKAKPVTAPGSTTVASAPSRKPKRIRPKGFSTGSGSKVIICLANKQPKSPWSKKGSGFIWRATAADQRDPEGTGEMCFNFKPPKTGTYYLTAVTSAPHRTDNNDMWIKLDSGLGVFSRDMKKRESSSGYYKAYQNLGGNQKVDIISNVDYNPHQFITNTLQGGSTQTLCMSGRSSRFTVYKFVLVHCSGQDCDRYSTFIKDSMKGMTSSC